MPEQPPVLEYARPAANAAAPVASVAALVLLLVVPSTICACGHLDWASLAASGPAAALAWTGFALNKERGVWRIVFALAVVAGTIALAKNVADILWFGHTPLLRPGG